MTINIVLLSPEIPQNTGNIVRTCAVTGAKLHLVEPLGFSIDNKYLKRAGLDYWDDVDISIYKKFEDLLAKFKSGRFYFCTTKALNNYTDINYPDDVFLVFGSETSGLPEELLKENKKTCIRIPMLEDKRSLNLANSVVIVLYEVLRQSGFKNMRMEGNLTKYNWD